MESSFPAIISDKNRLDEDFDDLIPKCISLIFVFLYFIAKKVIHSLVKRICHHISFKYTGDCRMKPT